MKCGGIYSQLHNDQREWEKKKKIHLLKKPYL